MRKKERIFSVVYDIQRFPIETGMKTGVHPAKTQQIQYKLVVGEAVEGLMWIKLGVLTIDWSRFNYELLIINCQSPIANC
ncbi:MAG: hypothetical protein DHS20C17_11680 [Cyclobacteriaceae bacterium]|nr:MAG: hypothetical protein DHS20C17_11680 [Cyclobacteriaceae bacterium]